MKLLSSISIGAIHCSQQSVNQSAAVDEFVDQRLTCRVYSVDNNVSSMKLSILNYYPKV